MLKAPNTILDLEFLRTFIAIADTGNFSKAAEAVYRTPSAVSMQVKKLEEQLSVQLFERDARSVRLTSHGEKLLAMARQMLSLNREIVSQFTAPDLAGVVRIGVPDDLGMETMPRFLRLLAETHPHITVDVVVDHSARLIERFNAGRLDISIINSSMAKQPDGFDVLTRERLVWAGLKCGVACLQDPLPISIWEDSCSWRNAALAGLDKANRAYRVAYLSAHCAAQCAAVRADLAIAPLPESSLNGDIQEVGPEHNLPPIGDYAISMAVAHDANAPVLAAALHVRQIIGDTPPSFQKMA